jgi:hypothetical protein
MEALKLTFFCVLSRDHFILSLCGSFSIVTDQLLTPVQDLSWSGELNDPATRSIFEPDIYIRVPAGASFTKPIGHFMSAWIFHPLSRVMHVNDTIFYVTTMNLTLKVRLFLDLNFGGKMMDCRC